MAIQYNQKCARCKKKYVLVSSGQFPVCYDCQKKDLDKPIKDAKMKKVQVAIQGDTVRISGPSRDDLQEAIAFLKQEDFGVELKFENFRSQ